MFCKRDREQDEQAEALSLRRERRADREALGQAVDEQHAEDEHGAAHAVAAQRADVDVAAGQQSPPAEQEQHAGEQAGGDGRCRAFVERGRQQADDGRHGHDAGGEAPQQRAQGVRPPPEREHRDRAEAGGERRAGAGEHQEPELAHGRLSGRSSRPRAARAARTPAACAGWCAGWGRRTPRRPARASAASNSPRAIPSSDRLAGMPTAASSSSTRANSRSRRSSGVRPPSPWTQAIWAYLSGAT